MGNLSVFHSQPDLLNCIAHIVEYIERISEVKNDDVYFWFVHFDETSGDFDPLKQLLNWKPYGIHLSKL